MKKPLLWGDKGKHLEFKFEWPSDREHKQMLKGVKFESLVIENALTEEGKKISGL